MSGPSRSSIVHSARPPRICQISLASSAPNGARSAALVSGERKKDVLQSRGNAGPCPQLVERALAANATAGEQHETVAYALGVDELMGREHDGSTRCRRSAQDGHHLTGLLEIEAVKRLIHEQQRLWAEQRERPHQPARVALGEREHRFAQRRTETDGGDCRGNLRSRAPVYGCEELQHARDILLLPG